MHTSADAISREEFWNIVGPGFPTGQVILYVFALIAVILFVYGLARTGVFSRFKVIANATGSDVDRVNNPWERFWYALVDVFASSEDLERAIPGNSSFIYFLGICRSNYYYGLGLSPG